MAIKNYKRMKIILSVFFLTFSCLTIAQKGFEAEILQFYKELNNGNGAKIKPLFLPTADIVQLSSDTVIVVSVDDFLKICPKFQSGQYREEVVTIKLIKWANRSLRYEVHFYLYENNKIVSYGIDEFTVVRVKPYDYLIDKIYSETRLYADAQSSEDNETDDSRSKKINDIMNNWHLSATEAELDDYFGVMHPEFIFLGTDPSERWTKIDFYNFCEPYFDEGKTWDFKINWRNVYFSKDRKTAWFEESLDTWMKESRGSGVLIYENGNWKLIHYNLTVLIENEKMKKFLKLRKKSN